MSNLICNICIYGMAISATGLAISLVVDTIIGLTNSANSRSKNNLHGTFN